MNAVPQITPHQLQALLAGPNPPCVLDVREGWEIEIARLDGSLHIPLNQIPIRLKELDASKPIIALCHAGGRSQRAAEFLLASGFGQVANLSGGIGRWSAEVDPNVPLY